MIYKNHAFLSLGSNIEDRKEHLMNAIRTLEQDNHIKLVQQSSIYETDPVGVTEQAPFLNMVVELETSYNASELLEKIKKIEQLGGRERGIRWGPRTIDLDILLYNSENINLEHLIVPHPRMTERGFVLIPLQEIAPNLTFNDGVTIEEYINQLTDKEGVRKWESPSGEDASEHSES
ncbi:MAG: 2-amino-4-hydroxy-6-hydroxymethyldihydropteridine diphosphokinase [Bacillus sp. (in: Bacteria)]|nr:2-amino-4-hydroxy-6-hydroxymethyldihydropteridine diphosphokinase [Bacillus sp. (in: firmicutes)]